MNNGQSYVVATAAVLLIILTVFLLPWRIERTDDLRWGPFYRAPITYSTAQIGNKIRSTIRYEKADLAVGILAVELLVLLVVSSGLYLALGDEPLTYEEDELFGA